MGPMLELLLCAAGVGVLFVLLDYRPAPSPAQVRAIKECQECVELEARVKEFMTLTPADLDRDTSRSSK